MTGPIHAITVLRGVAAILVVLFHAALDVRGRGPEGTFPSFLFGAAGVDVFLVLSGFVMVLSSARQDELMSAGMFCHRRIERIVPMYWIATILTLLHQAISNRHSFLLEDWPRHLACSLAFLPCYRNDLPFVVQGWTLEYEMAFYGMFAATLTIGRVSAVWGLMTLCFVAGLSAFCGLSGSGPYGSAQFLTEFALGMAIGLCRPAGLGSSGALLLVLVGILLFGLFETLVIDPPSWRLIVWGAPAALIVAGCSSIPNSIVTNRSWIALGDASYSIYVFHILIFKIAGRPLLGIVDQGAAGRWSYFSVISLSAVGLGVAAHTLVERPLQSWLRQPRYRMTKLNEHGNPAAET